jgi:replication-associated recombination protein RarA
MSDLFRIPLAEKYRPKSFEEVIGQPKLIGQIHGLQTRGGLGGRAYWLSGRSGGGKSSTAKLIAREVADDLNIEVSDARGLSIETLKEWERASRLYGLGDKHGRAFIVEEAHTLRKPLIDRLLVVVDTGNIPAHCVWLFTSTKTGVDALFEDYEDAGPLLSRCTRLEFASRNVAKLLAIRAKWIAEQESLDGHPLEDYVRLVNEHNGNMRGVLNDIEAGRMLPAQGGDE